MIENSAGNSPLPHQKRVYDLCDPEKGSNLRIVALSGGLGSGKSRCGATETIRHSVVNAPIPSICMAPSYPMAKHNMLRPIQELLEGLGYGVHVRWDTQEHVLHITSYRGIQIPVRERPEILFRSADNPKGVKGLNAGYVWMDEPGSMPEYPKGEPGPEKLIDIVVGRVRDPDAVSRCILLTGTPEGRNWYYQFVEQNPPSELVLVRASTLDNPYLPKDYYPKLLEKYGEKLAKMYLEGYFIDTASGLCYNFSDEKNLKKVVYDPSLPLLVGVDYNRNPGCHAVFAQKHGEIVHVLRDLIVESATTQRLASNLDAILTNMGHRQGLFIYADPAGLAKKTNSDLSDQDVLRDGLRRWNPTMCTRSVHQSQTVSVDTMNAALDSGRLVISVDKCPLLLYDFRNVRWKPNCQFPAMQIDKSDPKLTHASDALRYLVEQVCPLPARLDHSALVSGEIRVSREYAIGSEPSAWGGGTGSNRRGSER